MLNIKPILIICALGMLSCTEKLDESQLLKQQIKDLEEQVEESYRPGLGEFMSSIQVHHAKLYFAGTHKNWKLADFEIQEIRESLEDITEYCRQREEVKSLSIIQPSLDSLNDAISKKNDVLFNRGFSDLTNACNSCHHATHFEFNVVKIPDIVPFSNQDFTSKEVN